MNNEVMRILNTTYVDKKIQALNKVCDYYNDGLYKKVRSKTIGEKYYEDLGIKNNKNKKEDTSRKETKLFPRDLLNRSFKLFDIDKQKVLNLKVINDEKENYKKGIINTTSPLTCCLVNKNVNDTILIRSIDGRKKLITEYRILEMN